ncbi:OstA-like protein [Parabacteroides sp. Marseille-P3160]|uniref:OstA-like protein n=1 Tax=Parabacteroides sp. Marseille-P3160 TaxID=1917887 RepID=UPI0009BACD27|nr:OstA-like protein [Parabacteroides sp. Marseille-P3160]
MRTRKSILTFLFIAFACCLWGQHARDSVPRKKTYIYLEHADSVLYNKEQKADAQILYGNVAFRHDSSYMYCDSAYFYEANNSLEAFSNVRMEQGDTLFVYGQYLYYDGNTELAKLRENVRMENIQSDSTIVTLFTDSLNYDRRKNIGYYFEGGLIVDQENELSSFFGEYAPSTRLASFNDSVKLANPKFTLYSDTLLYSTNTRIATILGPSTIVSDSGTIYSSRGWYNTLSNRASLLDRSQVVSGDRFLTGDSIAFDREVGLGEAFGNMVLQDTLKKVILEGQYGLYNDKTSYAFATDSARMIEYSQGDSLFLHADTLEMITIDSTAREIKAYRGVRFYRIDLQGVCDSMQFNTKDSTLHLFKDPILWNEKYQLYGDTIVIFMKDSTIDFVHVYDFAFAAQEVDTSYYNQLKGRDLKAFFQEKELERIEISGNAESIYYPLEKDGSMLGLNSTQSGFLTLWMKERKMDKLKIWTKPQGLITPIPDLKPEQKTLRDFQWFDYIRPLNKDDIFRVVKRQGPEQVKRSNKFVH